LLGSSGKLVVADAFGGRLAVVDVNKGAVDSVRSLPSHNFRGLALSRDAATACLCRTSFCTPLGSSSLDDIHWGNVLTNHVRTVRVADLLDPKSGPCKTQHA